jgi:hypothetical protein
MRSGSGATHNLAVAAGEQTVAMRLQVQRMETLAAASAAPAGAALETATAAMSTSDTVKIQASASKTLAEQATKQLQLAAAALTIESFTPEITRAEPPFFTVRYKLVNQELREYGC